MSTRYFDKDGDVRVATSSTAATEFERMGFVRAEEQLQAADKLKEEYSDWYHQGVAAVSSFAENALPGSTSAVLGAVSQVPFGVGADMASAAAKSILNSQEANPTTTTAAGLAGTGALLAGGTLAAGPVGAAGVGALGAAGAAADQATLTYLSGRAGSENVYRTVAGGGVLGLAAATVAAAASPILRAGAKLVAGGANKLGGKVAALGSSIESKGIISAQGTQQMGAEKTNTVIQWVKDKGLLKGINTAAGNSPELKASLKSIKVDAEQTMNLVKFNEVTAKPMPLDEAVRFKSTLNQLLSPFKNAHGSIREALEIVNERGGNLTLDKMHQISMRLGKAAGAVDTHPDLAFGAKGLSDAYQFIGGAMQRRLETSGLPADLIAAWPRARTDYYMASLLSAHADKSVSSFMRQAGGGVSAAGAAIGGAVGGAAGAPGVGAFIGAKVGEKASEALANPRAGGRFLSAVGQAMLKSDGQTVDLILRRLSSPEVAGGVATFVTRENFDHVYSTLNYAHQNTADAYVNLQDHLSKTGLPPPVVDALTEKQMQTQAFLLAMAPKNPNTAQTAMPQEWSPTPQQLAKFNRYVAAANDPNSAIAHPTREGLETLKALYPDMLERSRALAMNILNTSKNPSRRSREWAANFLEMPTKSLAISQNYAIFQEAVGAQGAQKPGGARGNTPAPQPFAPRQSTPSQLERLQDK